MAIQCTLCGTTLKDEARFCNYCGTLVPSHPFSPKATASSTPPAGQTGNTSSADNTNNARVVMREQIAQQPPYRPTRRRVQDEPPSWISQLDGEARGSSSRIPSDEQGDPPQLDFPVPEPIHRSNSPVRELRVKVWEQEEGVRESSAEDAVEEDDDIEDAPTRPLVASSPDLLMRQDAPLSPARKTEDVHLEDVHLSDHVELLDTVPLVTPKGVKPVPTPHPAEESLKQSGPQQQAPGFFDRSSDRSTPGSTPVYPPQTLFKPYSRPISQPVQEHTGVSSTPPAQDLRQTPPPQEVVSPPKRRKNRKSLLIVLVSLVVFVVGGSIGAWVILVQPFSIPGVTQPQQSFTNTQLGLSLFYPSGWKSQVDLGKRTIHFYDSSNTDQVNIVVTASGGGDMGQYLQQEANRLGMTGLKMGTPVSFARASWQQIQGSVLLRGASYTEALFVTTHNRNNVTIMFLAPQTTYAQEEQLVFSSMRSSFQFLK